MGVIMSKRFQEDLKLDGSLKSKAWDFLGKLVADDDLTGLDLKKPKNPADSRVRTARVNQQFRAVLFAVGDEPEPMWLLAAVKNHDDAYKIAETIVYEVNQANGAMEVFQPSEVERTVERFRARTSAPEAAQVLPFTPTELIGVGINARVAAEAIRATTEDDILVLAADLPAWQQQVLLDLATGSSLDAVRAVYCEEEPVASGPLAAARRAASRMEFAYLDTDDELRRMLAGDFAAWRTYLHPTQRSIANRETYSGPFRLAGGPGTGKTVVALHRTAFLAARGSVLLCTFTRNLAARLGIDLRGLVSVDAAARTDVSGVDQLVRRVVETVDGQAGRPLDRQEEDQRWEEAVQASGTPEDLARKLTPSFLSGEYRTVVLALPEAAKESYLRARRTGRGVRLNRVQRTAVWRVFEAFDRGLRAEGRTTYDLLAGRAAAIVADPELRWRAPRYDHVVVDEGQDLHAGHWRVLRGLVDPGPDDIFVCEDGFQRIYGERIVLGQLGIATRGRSRRLTLNYRTTRQNLHFAMSVIETEPVVDLDGQDDTVAGYRSSFDGPAPQLHGFETGSDELRFVTQTVQDWLADDVEARTIAIVSRWTQAQSKVRSALTTAGVAVDPVDRDESVESDAVKLVTMHRSKGTEFSRVIVIDATDGALPANRLLDGLPEPERTTARARERSLFYVACTRARDELIVTWAGPPSSFIPRTS